MIGILVKNRLLAVFGSVVGRAKRGKEIKKATLLKKSLFALLYLFIIGMFLALAVGMAYLFGSALLPGAEWLYYLLFMVISLTLTFILSIFETKVELFECKDNDLLLSMPIKPRDIIAARVSVVMIYNYVINAIVMLPAIVVYGIMAKDIAGVFGGILVFLLLPLFATALASLVGYLVAEIARKLKFKNLVTILVTFIFLGLYFWVVELIENNLESILEGLMGMSADLAEKYKILPFIGNAARLKPLSILAVGGVSILSAVIAYLIISSAYVRIVTDRTGAGKIVYKEKRLKVGNALTALTKKDVRKFFASPLYVLNGFLGLIFAVALGVFAILKRDMVILIADAFGVSNGTLGAFGVGIIALTVSMTIISACALSLEGKEFWIIKTMPIPSKTVICAKALMQFVISFVPVLISTVLVMIAISASAVWWIVYIIVAQIYSALFSLGAILINVAFPKFDYDNEAQVVKQSLSTLVSMFGGMLISAGVLVGAFFLLRVSSILSLLLLSVAPIIILLAEILLIGPAAKRYESFNL